MKSKNTARLSLPFASAIAALLASSALHADVLTWDNGAATGNWNTTITDLNWTGAAAWNNATPDDAIFDATGVGTVTLTEAISAGSVTINTAGYTITGNTLTLSGGATALITNATSAVDSNITLATAAGTITSNTGTLTLGGTVDAGSLALTFAGAGNTTVSNGIANGTTLTKSGAGTLILGGANNYTGATTISTAILQAGSTTGLSPNSDISLASGTRLVLGGFSSTVGALNGTGGVVENANATPVTLTIGNTGANGAYASNLQNGTGGGAMSVIKTGTGAQAITNATFTGGLTINEGTWQLGGVNGLGNGPVVMAAGSKLSSNSNAARNLSNVLNTIAVNGSITLGDATNTGQMTLPGAVTLSSSPTITVAGGIQILSGVVSGTTFTKAGPGRLNLTNASNDYAVGTSISEGTLGASVDGNLGAAGTGITVTGDAALALGSVTYARGITLNNAAILSFDSSNPTISGNVTGTGGVSNLSGFGNQVNLSGTNNTFEGQVRIGSTGVSGQAYRFQFSSLTDSASANGTIRFSASRVTHADGSVFQYNGSTDLILANRQIEFASATGNPSNGHQIRSSGSGTLTINTNLIVSGGCPQTLALRGSNTGANTFAGVISDSAVVGTTPLSVAFTTTPTSTITLASVQGITVGATISGTGIAGGTTITAIDTSTRVVTLSADTNGTAGAIGQIMTIPGVINPTSITKNADAGTWTLSGNNTHSGGTTFSTGKLNINHAGALGTGNVIIGAGTFDNTSGAPITNANNNTISWNGDNTFTGTNSLDLGTGAVTLGGTRNLAVSANTLTFGGNISGTGAQEIRKAGGGTLAFTSVSSGYLGKTSVQAGTLQISSIADYNSNSSLGAVASGDIQLGNTTTTGTLNYIGSGHSSNRTFTIGSNTATAGHTGGGRINANGGDLTLNATNFNTAQATASLARTLTLGGIGNGAISGIIQDNSVTGTVRVTKTDAGKWTLSGPNTYTGATAINGGTLVITGATQSTNAITFSGGGILGLDIATPVTAANATVDFTGQSVLVTGSPILASYTLLTANSMPGTEPTLAAPAPAGYELEVVGNELRLVQTGGLTGYALWASVNAPTGDPNEDFDGDGVSNAVEFVLGGLATTNDLDKLPVLATNGTTTTFTFKRDQDSIDPKTTVTIEVGTDLVIWNNPSSPYAVPDSDTGGVINPGVTVEEGIPVAGTDTVTLRVPQAPDTKKFARLKVVITP